MSHDQGFDWGNDRRDRGFGAVRPLRGEFAVMPRSPSEALEPSRAPEPPNRKQKNRMHPVLAFINRAMTLFIILFGLGAGVLYYVKQLFDQPGPLTHSTVVVIPRGEGVSAIASRLENQNVIIDKRLFVASVFYFEAQKKLKAGEYQISKGASMRQVLDTISQGRSVLHKISIPEGLTTLQIMQRMEGHDMLAGTLLKIPEEGTLLPDTYKFTRGLNRAELIERMQAEQRSFIDKLWDNRAPGLPFKTKREAIILASIVEKETGRPDERRRVAGVFVNRLKRKMRLQSDPTIIYGIAGGRGTLGRPLLRSEIKKKTAYNTYQIDGLPPGPIANPGRAAIEAVLNPAETKDIFFVADGTGGHIFAETLSAHNKNVKNWRKIEKELRAKQAAAAAAENNAASTPGQADEPAPTPAPVQPEFKALDGVQVVQPKIPEVPVQTTSRPAVQIPAFSTSTENGKQQAVLGAPVPVPVRKPAGR